MVFTVFVVRKKQLIQESMVGNEVITTEPQSNIKKHIVFLDMLQHGEVLRGELLRKAKPKELKAILELCFKASGHKFLDFIFFHISKIWSLTDVSTKFFNFWLSPNMSKLTANIGIFSL